MKRWIPWLIAALALGFALSRLAPHHDRDFAVSKFGRLPVVFNGRVQPFDSIARNSLLQIRGKQSVREEGKPELDATSWLLEVMFKPEVANTRRIFRIDHPDLKAFFDLPLQPDPAMHDDGKHYSWLRLQPSFDKFQEQVAPVQEKEASTRNTYEQSLIKLYNALTLYLRLENTVQPMKETNFVAEVADYQESIPAGVAAFHARLRDEPFDTNALERVLGHAQRLMLMDGMNAPLIVPPEHPGQSGEGWMRMSEALLESSLPVALLKHLVGKEPLPSAEVERLEAKAGTVPLNANIPLFARMAAQYQAGDPAGFNQTLEEYRARLTVPFAREVSKAARENIFLNAEPFYSALLIYVMAFVCVCAYWLGFWEPMRRIAWSLVIVAFLVHNAGLLSRMLLEGRPPVTNLYSSAVFIGWGAVGLGLLLERMWRNGIGLAVGSLIGFATLIIAHLLSLREETMIMLRAVLDTNFWLATHVTIVTLGYASTYVAGFLGLFYVVLGLFTVVLNEKVERDLTKMVYGIVCFATLFSFTGTVLGGIWADQSWGRFWGWDPKENGALIIVLWNALILHARMGGLVRERGFNLLAIGGNIVTSWSWFGTNMLNVGLHSYGFMDSAFKWLLGFVCFNLVMIALGLVPKTGWRSVRARKSASPPPKAKPGPPPGKVRPAAA